MEFDNLNNTNEDAKKETEQEMFQRIENFKNNLSEKNKELYDLCASFWRTDMGKEIIRKARKKE